MSCASCVIGKLDMCVRSRIYTVEKGSIEYSDHARRVLHFRLVRMCVCVK